MNPRGLAKLPYQVSSGSTNASSGSSGSSRNRGSSGSSKAQTVLSAVADVAIGTWANQKSIPKLQLQNYRIWTMEANTLASTCKTAGKVGGPVAMAFLAIDIVFDCMDYRGSNLKKAIGLDVFGFSAGVGSGWVIGAAAAACTNPYSAVVVGSVVILTVGSSLLINQVVSNAKNTYLT